MDFLPIFLKLSGAHCLVIGGGSVAARKVAILLRAQASVTVLSPELGEELTSLQQAGRIAHLPKRFDPGDITEVSLVVSATNLSEVNREIARVARERNIPVNVVDCPELCSFIFPAIVDRSPVVVAVSTGGASPILARQVRAHLESALPSAYGRLAELAENYRQRVKQAIPNAKRRRVFWESALSGPIANLIFAGRGEDAEAHLEQMIDHESATGTTLPGGFVSLVGAGPGDPDLLTLRALRSIQEADTIVHDRLVSQEVLDFARADVHRIFAGKANRHHTLPQEEINDLLVKLARQGQRVVRLKGGDPFIFGRGGEEIETLMAQGIPFQVIPGITAASGCAAYAGIPLTHRDHAQSVVFVTGHTRDGKIDGLEWAMLARPHQTLVIYMGLQSLPLIVAALLAHGSDPETPAAIIEQGTTPRQKTVTGTLSTLFELASEAGIDSPALTIVGSVVQLHERLNWFQKSPPTGK